MALLLKCGAVFLHIPKTGGSWVTEVLEEQGLIQRHICHIHSDLHQVLRYLHISKTLSYELSAHIKPYISLDLKRKLNVWSRQVTFKSLQETQVIDNTPYIFCFVRHPLHWYESFWRYMCKQKWPILGNQYDPNNWHPNAPLNGLGNTDFNQFVRNVIRMRPAYVTEMYGWYTLPGTNFVGKQENLAEDLITVLTELDVKFDSDRIRQHQPANVTESKSTPFRWDEQLCQDLLKLEMATFRRYGYE